jgi:hypothetical protein
MSWKKRMNSTISELNAISLLEREITEINKSQTILFMKQIE